MLDASMIDPLTYQPERQLWLRTLFLQATVVKKEPVETAARVLGLSRSTAFRWRQQFLHGDEGSLIDLRFGPSIVMEGLRRPRTGKDNDDASQTECGEDE